MDKYALRREQLRILIDKQYDGVRAAFAKAVGIDASYVSRALYPDGKAGRKRIGEDTIEKINAHHPEWLATGKGGKEAGAQPVRNVTQLPPPDPVLADLTALEPEQAEMWKDRLDEALARVKRIKSEIRAAAKVSQQQEDHSTSGKTKDDPHIEKSRASR